MRYLALVVLWAFVGCGQTPRVEEPEPMSMGRAELDRAPVSGRGSELRPSGASSEAVSRPVAGVGQVEGGAIIWEYDTVSQVQLSGLIRGRDEEARQRALRDALNEWGAQGWELVMVSGETFIFKRPASGF